LKSPQTAPPHRGHATPSPQGRYPFPCFNPWTVFDLTAFTSENAKFAILWVSLMVVTPGTSGDTSVSMRKNGTTATKPYVASSSASHPYARAIDTLIIGLDDERKIEGKLALATGASGIYLDVAVLGYIE
ncbi:unnamed protein product, partial [marine sediment metagenome]